jgi:hypothetical protein
MDEHDKILDQIADEPEFAGSAADNLEMAVALTGQVEIAGRAFPAPAAAVVALLDAIDSPFVSEDAGEKVDSLDIFRAIYLIGERQKAALPVLRLMRQKKALEAMSGGEDNPDGVLVAARRQSIADAEAELDAAAVEYCAALGSFSPAAAAGEIGDYLTMATGFGMLPRSVDDGKKKTGTGTTLIS